MCLVNEPEFQCKEAKFFAEACIDEVSLFGISLAEGSKKKQGDADFFVVPLWNIAWFSTLKKGKLRCEVFKPEKRKIKIRGGQNGETRAQCLELARDRVSARTKNRVCVAIRRPSQNGGYRRRKVD
jgi:hypothetical protein